MDKFERNQTKAMRRISQAANWACIIATYRGEAYGDLTAWRAADAEVCEMRARLIANAHRYYDALGLTGYWLCPGCCCAREPGTYWPAYDQMCRGCQTAPDGTVWVSAGPGTLHPPPLIYR
jgi:hypothetical protein